MGCATAPAELMLARSPPFLLADDEESRIALKILRARFLAPLGMTGPMQLSHRLCWPGLC